MKKLNIILSIIIVILIITVITAFIMKTSNNGAENDKEVAVADELPNDISNSREQLVADDSSGNYEDGEVGYDIYSTTNSPEVDRVISFINWAKREDPQMKFSFVEGGLNSIKPNDNYSVNLDECGRYLAFLKNSGYLSDKYIDGWREHFNKYAKKLADNPANDGAPDGFEFSFLFLSQEVDDNFLTDITDNKSIIRYLKLNDNKSVIIFDEMPIRLQYTLSKYGDKYLIDDISTSSSDFGGDIAEVKTVLNFINWYKKHKPQYNHKFTQFKDNQTQINLDDAEKYLKEMLSSGYLSEKYIESLRSYFNKYSKLYKDSQYDDNSSGDIFKHDLVLQSMPTATPYDNFMATNMTIDSVVDYIKINDNSSKVIVSDGGSKLIITLSKTGEKYLIDDINDPTAKSID